VENILPSSFSSNVVTSSIKLIAIMPSAKEFFQSNANAFRNDCRRAILVGPHNGGLIWKLRGAKFPGAKRHGVLEQLMKTIRRRKAPNDQFPSVNPLEPYLMRNRKGRLDF
jgi:hypothetical protein